MYVCVCACVRACVHECVRACVSMFVCVCARARVRLCGYNTILAVTWATLYYRAGQKGIVLKPTGQTGACHNPTG